MTPCVAGYQDITYALQSNYSMKHIPFPTYDLQSAMKTSPDRVDSIVRRWGRYCVVIGPYQH